ncbi:MAG: ABC transporter permease [Anaerolineaceae bacterium]|nr:ABC transporter permease [Anaerolineaceae bacterium]
MKKDGSKRNFRISKFIKELLIPILAVFTAIVVGGIVIYIVGGNPFAAFRGLFEGSFGSLKALSETTVWATPYIFAGLAVAVAFNGGLFNIGVEGQLAFGAVAAAWAGYALPALLGTSLPKIIHLPLTIIAGVLAGFIWGGIPGWLKAKFGGNEVINTIMMNYVALNLTSYLLNGPMKDPSPTNVIARTPKIVESAQFIPIFQGFRFHLGFILGIIVVIIIYVVLYKTTFGFEIRTVGTNPSAGRYAGINSNKIIFLTMAISGALAGLAGATEVTALNFRHELGFSVGYGFDAIAIALLGKNNPIGVFIAAILFGAMKNGATRMQFLTQIPVDIISIIQALILLFVAADVIIRFIYRIHKNEEKAPVS